MTLTYKYYFEDFKLGEVQSLGHTVVDKEEVMEFASRYDPQPFHVDEVAAKESIYGGLIASGWHTCAMVMRMMCDSYLEPGRKPWLSRPGQRTLAQASAARRHHSGATRYP